MLTREQQASHGLKELGVDYTRPIPLRKVLKMIAQMWKDKEAGCRSGSTLTAAFKNP